MANMNYGFDHDQLQKDWHDFVRFLTGFGKSFAPSTKKVKGKQIGFFEEMHIRFRLSLVEMGISKLIRTVIVLIVALAVFLPLFIKSQIDMKFILVFAFIIFYVWMMMEHLVVDGKPVDNTAKLLVGIHSFWGDVYSGMQEFVSGVFSGLNPFAKK